MAAVCAVWETLGRDIVRDRPFYDIQLQNVGRRTLGVEPSGQGMYLHDVRPCPNPVVLFDAPKIWENEEGEAKRELVNGFLRVLEDKFERWKPKRVDRRSFGWPQ